ncbi:hypothetical protein EIG75_19255 [Pseudomonas syringae]|uniref:Lipoprotein n=1 Tax=Pseudomonas syringae TaxID=317 RepID=A0A6B2ASV5_PSESX|nr:hypothetical protein [Pseudomonas syringae]AKF52320.1 hypothetical protein PsyrH_17820 [Pseudomonas syringae pv. syringae HS191]MBI6561376.1 hypothetical protein [Pseudomonas syringae]MBI6571209.1 hypothetical protein [Pseudomonas syringae]MBI6585861.1 hypothetical protein [Pseudomonas syringae]MBI6592899.1 hypothetical protein [Pseudomonas syringae]
MLKMIAAVSVLAITSAIMTGCNDKDGSKESAAKVTNYATDKCAIDSIGGKTGSTVYLTKGMAQFNGWAIDTANQRAPKEIRLRLTGYKGTPVTFKDPVIVDRPDLIKAFGNENFLKSGFSFSADLSSLESGGYSVVTEIPGDHSSLLCQSKVLLVIE